MKTFVAGAAALLAMTFSASAEMPKIKTGLKINDPRPMPATTGGTAVLNNQTFTVPSSVVGNAAELRRMKALSVLPARQRGSTVPPKNPYGVPTTIVVSGKPAANATGVLSARRLPNTPVRRCSGGAWTC